MKRSRPDDTEPARDPDGYPISPRKLPLKYRWQAWRDKMADRLRRPDFFEGNADRRDRAANRFKRPDWLDRDPTRRDKVANRFTRPAWMDKRGKWRDRAANTVNRPEFLDRPSRLRDSMANRFNRPEWMDQPTAALRDRPALLTRPDALDQKPDWVIRFSESKFGRYIAVALLAVALAVGSLAVLANPGPTTGVNGISPSANGINLLDPNLLAAVPAGSARNTLPTNLLATLPGAGAASASRLGDTHTWIATRAGVVFNLNLALVANSSNYQPTLTPAIDLSTQTSVKKNGGILAMAEAPDGSQLFVSMTDASTGNLRLVGFAISKNYTIDEKSEREIMNIPHTGEADYGGGLAFGRDGFLYYAIGVGGDLFSGSGIAQSLSEISGSIVRINPLAANLGNQPYQVPQDNPYVGQADARPELWAKGVHAGVGLSFDSSSGDLWLMDAGNVRNDEIDHLPAIKGVAGKGANLGWDLAEADDQLLGTPPPTAVRPAAILPIESNGTCPLIGGMWYHNKVLPTLTNAYLFTNGCSHALKAAFFVKNKLDLVLEMAPLTNEAVSGIGADGSGEPLIFGDSGGIYSMSNQAVNVPALVAPVVPANIVPPSKPPGTVCGFSAALVRSSGNAILGKPAVQVRELMDAFSQALANFRAAAPPELIDAFQHFTTQYIGYRKLLSDQGDVLPSVQSSPKVVQAALKIAQDKQGLSKIVAYESAHCGNPNALGNNSTKIP